VADHRSLSVELGGIRLLFEPADPDLRLDVDRTMGLFACPPVDPHIRATVRRTPLGADASAIAGRLLFRSGGVWELWDSDGDYLFTFSSPAVGEGPYKTARFDRGFANGRIDIRPGYPAGTGPRDALLPLEYPLDELVVMHWLAQGRGVELHACGIVEGGGEGQGYLFVGHSGAGKTTLAGLWPEPAVVLSDDRIIVRFEEGRPWIYGTPWHGEARLSSPGRAPLTRIFLIEQSEQTALVSLPTAVAAARLLSCSFVPFHDKAGLAFTVEMLGELSCRVPCDELRFRRDSSFAKLVRGIP
jgi:hypothetical protein